MEFSSLRSIDPEVFILFHLLIVIDRKLGMSSKYVIVCLPNMIYWSTVGVMKCDENENSSK